MKILLLIDANALIHRAFHALPPLTTKGGKPIQAVYGVASILLKIWREEKPEYAAALFDRPEPTLRKQQFAEYKAQRPKAPDELVSQIIEAHHLFPKFGIKVFERPGFEADDLIASFAEKFKNESDLKIVILTGDKDALQLVHGDKIVVKSLKKGIGETVIYNESEIEKVFGLKPLQLIDYKALSGDPSDNIKGIPGIGPKTATKLLAEFGSLENLYANIEKTGSAREKLEKFKNDAALARQLVILKKDVPLEANRLEDLAVPADKYDLVEYFEEMGFEALLKRLNPEKSSEKPTVKKRDSEPPDPNQKSLF